MVNVPISTPSNFTSRMNSLWNNVQLAPPDAILGVTDRFKADQSPNKINLGVGAYRDNNGSPYIFNCIRKAQEKLLNSDHEYTRILGIQDFNNASILLAYGDKCEALQQQRIAVAQSISGTGALRIGGEFLKLFYNNHTIYLPIPTWPNHQGIFSKAGISISQYRYYNPQTKGLDLDGMIKDIKAAPKSSIFLFHACAHNPTGVDPTPEEWKLICEACVQQEHLCFFDLAYQGFATGCPDKDAYSVRLFVEKEVPILLAQSYAKNFGLYG